MKPETHTLDITTTARSMSAIAGAVFMVAHWAFQNDAARALTSTMSRDVVTAMHDSVREQATSLLGTAATSLNTVTFHATRTELEYIIACLRACHAEFGAADGARLDFRISADDASDVQAVGPDDLIAIADDLERNLLS
jgi:hypothetical protein